MIIRNLKIKRTGRRKKNSRVCKTERTVRKAMKRQRRLKV